MSLKNFCPKKLEIQRANLDKIMVRVSFNLSGKLKKDFFDDCIKRNDMTATTARNIVEIYYSIIGEFPELKDKEFGEIKYRIIKMMRR